MVCGNREYKNMINNKDFNRRSLRLKGYNYASAGAYFITICAYKRESLFGYVVNGVVRPNRSGRIVESEWLRTEGMREDIELDKYVIMPNHLHGVLIIKDFCRGVLQYAPTTGFHSPSKNIGAIVRGFKSTVCRQINKLHNTPGRPIWQRNYYDHIIRNVNEMHLIRNYIINNPLRWEYDRENPAGCPDKEEGEFWEKIT